MNWKSVATALSAAILLCVALLFLWTTRAFMLIMLLGITFGVTLSRAATWLDRFHVRRAIGTILVLAAFVASVGIAAWRVAPGIAAQGAEIERDAPAALDQVEQYLRNRTFAGVAVTPRNLDSRRVLVHFFSSDSKRLYRVLFPFLASSVETLAGVLLVLFIAIYVSAEPAVYRRGTVALFPRRLRDRADAFLSHSAAILRQWLVARLLAMVLVGALTAVALWLDGVPGFGALGVVAAVLEFIPIFGPIISALPAIAMGLTVSPAKAVSVIVIFVVIQQIEGNVITPLIMRSRISVPPLITIASVTTLGIVFGVLGMLVAEPVAALAIALTQATWMARADGDGP